MILNSYNNFHTDMHTITLVMPEIQNAPWNQIISDIEHVDLHAFPFPDDYDESLAGLIREDSEDPTYREETKSEDLLLHEKAVTGFDEDIRNLLKHDLELLRQWASEGTQEKEESYGCFGSIASFNGGCYFRGSAIAYLVEDDFLCSLNSVYLVLKRLLLFMITAKVDYHFMIFSHNGDEYPFS